MKKIIIICILFALTSKIQSQNWYPIGAKWYFNNEKLTEFEAHGLTCFTVLKDTLVGNYNAKLIHSDEYNYLGQLTNSSEYILYENSEKVYLLNDGKFDLMYDFSASVGDTLNILFEKNFCDSISPVIVDSISSLVTENEIELKVQYVSYIIYAEGILGYNVPVSKMIIEKIGCVLKFIFQSECDLTESFANSELRCYHDNNISYVSDWWKSYFSSYDCDSIINETDVKIETKSEKKIHLTQTENTLIISALQKLESVKIYDLYGRLRYQSQLKTNIIINRNSFGSGIYLLFVQNQLGETHTIKFKN